MRLEAGWALPTGLMQSLLSANAFINYLTECFLVLVLCGAGPGT
jgi:hypothetical protein